MSTVEVWLESSAMPSAIHRAHSYDSFGRRHHPRDSGDITQFQYLNGQIRNVPQRALHTHDGSHTTFEQSFKGRDVTITSMRVAILRRQRLHFSFDSDASAAGSGRTRYIVENVYGKLHLADVKPRARPDGCNPSTDTISAVLRLGFHHGSPRETAASDTMHYGYQDPKLPDRPSAPRATVFVSGQNVIETSPMTE